MRNLLSRYRGVQVLLIITAYLLLAPYFPLTTHRAFYTISICIKDILMWILPLTVAFFIAHAVDSFKHRAPLFIITLILFEATSNFCSVWYGYLGAHLSADFLPSLQAASIQDEFSPLWRLPFIRPTWWSADKGAFLGLGIGFWAALSQKFLLKQIITNGKNLAQWVLTNIFSRIIPLFVLGFVARMHQMQLFQHIVAQYGLLLLWLVVFLSLYLIFLCWIGSGFKGLPQAIKNILPAGGIALSSGCSISTMPWTIEGASKNLHNKELAKAVIPATTNIQQIGDCITQTFLCFLIYNHFFGHSPDLITWLNFSLVFVLARFATAAVLGGAIFIMIPIYETYLSFTTEMIAIILAFNVILDPLITSSNVIANGALCRVFEKVWSFVLKKTGSSLA